MSGGVDFGEVFAQTAERLCDPVAHFRDLDLWLPELSPANAQALRGALVELLQLGVRHALIQPVAHGLASMYAAKRYGDAGADKWSVLGIITGLEAAEATTADKIRGLRDLVEKVGNALIRAELERLKRKRRVRK